MLWLIVWLAIQLRKSMSLPCEPKDDLDEFSWPQSIVCSKNVGQFEYIMYSKYYLYLITFNLTIYSKIFLKKVD